MSRSAAPDDAFEAWRRRAADADILEVALGGIVNAQLRKKSREHVGPCPMCGGGSNEKGRRRAADGFAVNPGKRVFNCRRGCVGGDVIAMVMHTRGVPFNAACELIIGEPPPARDSVISEETRRKSEQLQAEAAERERRRLEDENIYRAREIRTVRDIYDRAHPFAGSSAEIYAGIRGLTFPPAPADRAAPIKCVEAMPYHIDKDTIVHRGPAMVAPIINAKREFQGLHFTYLDLAREKGKLQLEHEGEPVDAKKSRGSKQGNFVALYGAVSPEFLVIGEGIEKAIAVYMALESTGRDLSAAAFWSACDLGNLSGRSAGTVAHPTLKSEKTGRPIKVAGAVPDLAEPAMEIPDSVADLLLLGDSTSDLFTTRLAMARAATRYARPGRTVRIAWAPDGTDFDDLLRQARGDEAANAAALHRIAGVVDSAEPFVDVQPLTGPELRAIGKAELSVQEERVRSAVADGQEEILRSAAEELGSLIPLDAIVEGFATEALFRVAGEVGLVRDIGAKAVQGAIAAGVKLGKKRPRDLSEVRGAAPAALRAPHSERRTPAASDPLVSSATASAAFPADIDPLDSPAPPDIGGESMQTFQTEAYGSNPSAKGGRGKGKPPCAEETEQDRNLRLAFFPLTDLGNAERFRERYRDKLLWHPEKETWLAWNGKRWSTERASEVVKCAEHITVRAIQDEAKAVRQSGRRDVHDPLPGALDHLFEQKRDGTEVLYSDKIARWGRSSEALSKISALSKLGGAYLAVSTKELDADKMKINVNNGTLVISRKPVGDYVNLQAHDPADRITKISPANFDPAAECPEYDKFLSRVHPSYAMRVFLHQWLGLSLTGDVSEQKLVYLYGFGANGKSVLMDTVSYVAGDYGETVPIETFLDSGRARSAGQASPDLAILPGVRMLRTSEAETNSKLAEAMVKLVTGGEPVLARHLNKGFFKFYPQFKLTISGNHKPKISGSDDGIWRRFQLVPFRVQIPKEERDRKLCEKLITEASGILNRLLDGLRDWCDRGLIEPEEVTAATTEYREMSDPLGRFLKACTEASPGDRVQSSTLYAVFEAWCRSAGESAWKQKGFSMAMDERGFKRKHSNGTQFLDIKLIRGVHDFTGDTDGQSNDAGEVGI